ncbi:MAG: hypothetical protein KDB88_02660 [Flavobacteriales bacterium]|nr:hypothetical protein [Flavobacteriales bacterium]
MALVLLNAVVRFLFIGLNELAHDEPFTVFQAHRSLTALWEMLRSENNPPLYFLLIKCWLPVAGHDAAWLRLPSAMASALTVWPLFLTAARMGNMRIGWTAALLFTFSSFEQGFAHEVRAYSLLQLLGAATIWQVVRHALGAAHQATIGARTIGWAILLNIMLVYTHFFGWLIIGIQALAVLLLPSLHPARRMFLKVFLATCLSYLPYGLIFLERATSSIGQGTWLTVPEPEEMYNMVWRFSNAPVTAVVFLGVAVLTVARSRTRSDGYMLGLIWGLLPLPLLFLVSQWVPVFLDRYLSFAAPGFFMLVSFALNNAFSWTWARIALPMAGILGMAITFSPDRPSEYQPSLVVAVSQTMAKQDGQVLIVPHWYKYTYAWHTDPELFEEPEELDKDLARIGILPLADRSQLSIDPGVRSTVVLVDAGAALVGLEEVEKDLRGSYPEEDRIEAGRNVVITRFRR